jgi:hypothetical protein
MRRDCLSYVEAVVLKPRQDGIKYIHLVSVEETLLVLLLPFYLRKFHLIL